MYTVRPTGRRGAVFAYRPVPRNGRLRATDNWSSSARVSNAAVRCGAHHGETKGRKAGVINFLLVMCEGRINQPRIRLRTSRYGRRTRSDRNYCILPDGHACTAASYSERRFMSRFSGAWNDSRSVLCVYDFNGIITALHIHNKFIGIS